jgi:hypothetical protein
MTRKEQKTHLFETKNLMEAQTSGKRRCTMFTAEISRTVKILVVAAILLTVTFAQCLFAKEVRDKGDRAQNNTQAQKAEKSARQEKTASSPASVQPTIREAPRGDTSMRPATQPAIQQPQRQITPSTQRPADMSRPQTRITASLPNPSPTLSVTQPAAAKPIQQAVQSRNVFRNPTTPSGVEVRQLTNANPPDKSRIIAKAPDTTIRGNTNIASPPAVIVERPGNSKSEPVKSIDTEKSRSIKAILTDSLKANATPVQEKNKAERTDVSDKTSLIPKPIVQTATKTPVLAVKKRTKTTDIDKKVFIQDDTKTAQPSDNLRRPGNHRDDFKSDDKNDSKKTIQIPSKENDKTKDNSPLIGSGDHDKTRNADKPDKSTAAKEPKRSDKNESVRPNKDATRDFSSKRPNFIRSKRNTISIDRTREGTERFRPVTARRVIYEDRSNIRDLSSRHEFFYRDRHNRLDCRIIQPRFYYPVCYNWGHNTIVHYVYPYYCHRFVFVSLGGYWPEYTCVRYYWYPTHPYEWYGYTPVAQQVEGDTYNYYTYNYYNTQPTAASTEYNSAATGITPVNADTFADVREKLSQQQAPVPDEQTTADTYFDEGVNAFGQGSYAEAEERFARAMGLAPEDMILPFAYGQAMLAQGKYAQAAEILRLALQKSSPDKQGVYFPRGLYLDENTLMDQIDTLAKEAENNPFDNDLPLLLGYQLLGVGQTENAIEPLNRAKNNYTNSASAALLIDLAEKIKSGETQ